MRNRVKQGYFHSLFNLYVNDLPTIFNDDCNPVTLHYEKLNCLLYADDLILLSESESGLQRCLDRLLLYCTNWNLSVNVDKSKVMIFNKNGKLIADIFISKTNI